MAILQGSLSTSKSKLCRPDESPSPVSLKTKSSFLRSLDATNKHPSHRDSKGGGTHPEPFTSFPTQSSFFEDVVVVVEPNALSGGASKRYKKYSVHLLSSLHGVVIHG